MPVLATYFSVRRGRDPFFKFFMRTIFPKQVKDYEEKFGIRFLGWYNVAHGWDFDNVILLDLPDYATLDKLEADEGTRALGHRAGEVDLRTPPLDVPARAHGSRSRVTTLRLPDTSGGEPAWIATCDLLGELASDAALERSGLHLPVDRAAAGSSSITISDRIAVLGGLTLIDEEPDYLSIAPDLTFRSRSRYLDEVTGEWVSETEVLESAAELVELYNPADIYAAFAEAAREAAGLPAEPTAEGGSLEAAGISPEETRRRSARTRTPPPPTRGPPSQPRRPLETDDDEAAARRLYDLALEYQERSQRSEARLLDEFGGRRGRPVAASSAT